MSIVDKVKAVVARRAEARRISKFKAKHGDLKCPWCDTWQSECCTRGIAMRQHPNEPALDLMTCGKCRRDSAWLYGPGVWLYVGDRLKQAHGGEL